MEIYKIIACDLDGTLLNNNAEISRENIEAINELDKMGVLFVPCSGRSISEIPQNIRELPSVRYIIHSNGASVFEKASGRQISNSIPSELNEEIYDLFNSCEAHICFRSNGRSFVDANFQKDEDYDYYNVCNEHRVVVRNFATYVDDLRAALCSTDNIEVFSIFFKSYEEKQKCKEYLYRYKELRSVEVSRHNLEIVSIDAGKGNALYKLADLVGVPYSQTMSIGDGDNDRTVTEAAGLGLAVSNACESLKAIADEIICSNEEHVVEYVLKKYF